MEAVSPICQRSIPAAAGAPEHATPASTGSATRCRRTRTPRAWISSSPASARSSPSSSSSPAAAAEYAAPRRPARARRLLLRRAERAHRPERRAVLPDHARGPRRVVEPAGPAHGRHAGRAASLPGARARGQRRSSCGRTTRISATPGRPRWAGRRAQRRPARPRAGSARGACSSASPPRPARSPRRPTGTARPLRRRVRPPLAGSYERLFHDAGLPRLPAPAADRRSIWPRRWPRRGSSAPSACSTFPRHERRSHYFHARLPDQFDYVVHLDETRAVEPLDNTTGWEAGELAETFPSGL